MVNVIIVATWATKKPNAGEKPGNESKKAAWLKKLQAKPKGEHGQAAVQVRNDDHVECMMCSIFKETEEKYSASVL